ncbi:MAG: hypothetical protein BMS9Abin29_0503 [Gemmatimonadota bacterium]|nr:MAG: hypothetical protein BMS9Abin29_0503 [Gemmatimonadota bacterium]
MFGEALIRYLNSVVAFWRSSPASVILMLIIASMIIRMLCGRRRRWWGFGCCCCRCGCGCHGSADCGPECSCETEAAGE